MLHPHRGYSYKSWKLQQQTCKRCWTMLRRCHYRLMTLILVLSHFSLFHTFNTQRQTGCIFLYRDVDHCCCERKPWKQLLDILHCVEHRCYRSGGVLPRARHPRHWRAFKMEILGNCASIISICVAVRHLLFPTTHWVHIIAARCSPHAATVCFHNGDSVILAAKA